MMNEFESVSEAWNYDYDQLSIISEEIERRLYGGEVIEYVRDLEYLEDVEQICRIQNYPVTLTVDENRVKTLWFEPARMTAIQVIERYTGSSYEDNLKRLIAWRESSL